MHGLQRMIPRIGMAGLLCGVAAFASGCGTTGGWMMNNSGMGYYQQGNYAMARHEFAMAVAQAPHNADYRHNLAMSMKRLGDVAGAERVLRHNLTINAMHQPTYHSLAQTLNEQGRQGEAFELVQTWVETQPYVAGAHVEMAWLQREMGNLPDAERELRQALQIEPQNPFALAHLGQLYQDAGQTSQAAALYQRSLAVNSIQPQVQSRLASIAPESAGPAATQQVAYRTAALPPPIFGGESMMPGPSGGMLAMGPQPLPSSPVTIGGTTIPAGAPIMTSQPLPASMSMTSIPTETIVLPPVETGPTLTTTAGPQLAPPAGTTIISTSPTPIPASSWQPVTQSASARSVNADPAHVPEMSALPVVEPH